MLTHCHSASLSITPQQLWSLKKLEQRFLNDNIKQFPAPPNRNPSLSFMSPLWPHIHKYPWEMTECGFLLSCTPAFSFSLPLMSCLGLNSLQKKMGHYHFMAASFVLNYKKQGQSLLFFQRMCSCLQKKII